MSTQHETLQQQAQEPPSRSSSSSHTSELSDDRTTQHSNDQERGRLDNKEDDSDPNNDPPPDGGYGWFIVLATFLSLFAVFGTNISWGVMQDYFEQNTFGESARVDLSFVSTLMLIATTSGSLFSRIFEIVLGMRFAFLLGSLLYTCGLVAAGSATEIWHLYLALGLCNGLGDAIIYGIGMRVTPQWFTKKRGTAMAMAASATGLGGLVIPFIMTACNEKLGASWTFRIIGLGFLAFNLTACALMKERVPVQSKLTGVGDFFRPALLKDVNFALWVLAAVFQTFYLYIPPFFIPSYATYIGLSAPQGSALVSVLSATNFVGRIAAGILADRIGCLNANLIYALVTCVISLALWTLAYDYGTLMAYAALFGFFGGSFYALCGPITVQVVGLKKYPYAFPLLMLTNIPALFGPPIVSAIEKVSTAQPFLTYKLFTGLTAFACAVVTIILRLRLSRKLIAKV
ncbi:mfs transporter [Lichtheimia corymbifera JMRC:FSU:9682]|uniref:Mfs transporter n=1 Tax=Lichtheimia corymbifera JMRC:FSU:9682 TaxID=1263082 RepID=A0A068SAB0_9FUNG|nr:mfs transporter [Lichtheimia corymbifera JMRC:FSU:9682]